LIVLGLHQLGVFGGGGGGSNGVTAPPVNVGPSSKVASSHRRSLSIALAAVSCVLAVAACGSSGSPSSAAGTGSGDTLALEFADCMRSHGVPNFPDPTFPSTGGMFISAGPVLNPQSPAVKQVLAACGRP
jgi:hypothetical protein